MVIKKIVKDKIALLTINREEALNAMNPLILNELTSIAASLVEREYDPTKQDLDSFVSNRLNLRANSIFLTDWIKSANPSIVIDADWSEPYIALSKVICLSSDVIPKAAAATEIDTPLSWPL